MIGLAALLAYAVAYLIRVRALARRGRPVPAWRAGCLLAGLTVLAVAAGPLVDGAADRRMTLHMAEHLAITDVAAPLLVLGLTGPVLAPLLRVHPIGALRALGHPLVALPLWAALLLAWHVPTAYDAAVRHDVAHVAQHACFLFAGIVLWTPLLGPFPRPAWFGAGAQLAYATAARIVAAALGNLLVWSGTALYASYSDLGDQAAAGALMLLEESVVMLAISSWLALRWIRAAGERQELAELAAARGVEIDERRVARAVAAGRGGELRRRLATSAAVVGRAPADR